MPNVSIPDFYTRAALVTIILLLGFLGLRSAAHPPSVQAEASYSHLFVDPGTTIIRTPDGLGQVQGKVVIDMRNGEVWGFPTATSAPYPVVMTRNEPPVSKPVFLGKFDFSAMRK